MEAWGSALHQRCAGTPLAIGRARTTGPLVSAWRTDAFLGLCPIQPLTLARARAACTPSRATEAPTAAARHLTRLLTQRAPLPPLPPPRPARRALAHRVAHRRRVVGDNVRSTQRLTRTLTHALPHGLHGLQEKAPGGFGALLRRWPPRQAAPRARRALLAPFCRDHHGRAADVIAHRRQAIKTATPLTRAEGVSAPKALCVQALVRQLRVPLDALETCDHARAHRAQSPPAFPLCQALPGAGPVCAPWLPVAFGDHRARSASATARQPDAGSAPVTERRGRQAWGPWRLPCPQCVRHTFVEGAAESSRPACWVQVSSQPQRDKGKAPPAAVRALAFTWLRLLSRGWHERTPYDEATSLQALTHRGSSLLHNLAQAS